MNKEPIYQGKDIFVCPDEMVIHPFFKDNQDNIALCNLQTFLDLYPSDLQLYIGGMKEIKSYKSVAASIRNFCMRQLHFLESPTGLAYVRALQDTEFVQTASASSESSSLLTSTLSTIAPNDDKGEEVGESKSCPSEPARSKAYEITLERFKGSPLLPYFRFIFRKAQGFEDKVPEIPTNTASENLTKIVAYTHRVLSAKDRQSNDDIKDVYVALSCIVSATVNDAANIFGTSLIARISNEVTLKEVHLPILAQILAPFHESFTKANLDLEFLQQEVELRLAEIVLKERHEGSRTRDENMDLMVSRQVYNIIHFFCVVIGSNQFENKKSETECVAYWSHVWRILFSKTCIIVNTGEIASVATKEDMHANEVLFSTVTQSGGRKTDTLVLAKEVSGGETTFVECSVNEHKPLHAGQSLLREQSRKVVRINRSILSFNGSKETALYLDAHGLCAKIYGIRAIDDVYGASAALGKICLPSNKFEMKEFLSGASVETLFRYKTQM